MIQKGTILHVLDNSAPVYIKCIHVYNAKQIGLFGDLILGVILKSIRNVKINLKNKSTLLKGTLCKCIIVQLSRKIRRVDGSSIKFDSNCCIVLNKQLIVAGTRIVGPITFELNSKVISQKFMTLAPLIL